MIRLDHIRFSYPGQLVLEDLSLTLEAGELVCLFGPSGCGKSTVLDIVAGLRPAAGGEREIHTQRIGYAFQDPRLLPWRSVRQNLAVALSGWFHRRQALEQAATWLERFGLTTALERTPAELSGGMRRRANLARAFALKPDLLLLDEPFAFLDESVLGVVREAITEVNREGVTVLLVSHVLEHIRPLGARVLTIDKMPVVLPR